QDAHRADGEVRRRRGGGRQPARHQHVAFRRAGRWFAGQRRAVGRPAGEARRQRLSGQHPPDQIETTQRKSSRLRCVVSFRRGRMIRIGLTGGIGAGKSTVAATFAECGGIIVDGDVIAREVVQPGTEGLAKLVETFGEDILLPDGSLDRPALAAKAFADDEQRATLNAIVHPLVGRRREEIIAAVPDDAVVVEDIPLLVETGMAPTFPLVVVVYADAEVRVKRLVEIRGMSEQDARARIAAQATDEQRAAIADVLLDNSGTQQEIVDKARALWEQRVLPLAENIRTGRCVTPALELV